MKKRWKNYLAIFLVILMFWQSQVCASAMPDLVMSATLEISDEREDYAVLDRILKENSDLISEEPLRETEPNAFWDKVKESAGENMEEEIIGEITDEMLKRGDKAIKDEMLSIKADSIVRSSSETSGQAQLAQLGKSVQFLGKAIGVATTTISLIKDGINVVYLNNNHVLTELTELMLILVDVANIFLGMFGMIGFPWSLLIGVVLGLLLDMVKSDEFGEWAESHFLNQLTTVDNWLRKLLRQNKTPNGVNALKPNIYIYSKNPQEVEVIFCQPERLIKSIPEYEDSWKVTVDVSGNLMTNNGENYRYLFYESKTYKDLFQTRTGYYISAYNREDTFIDILTEMGFTGQEISDFIEFWNQRLRTDISYIMYPQYTETVDEAMPLIITDEPDSIERIWFVFEEYKGQVVENPELYVLSRDCGFYVVEWGGLIFDE